MLYYKRNIKHFFRIDISYINTRENWKNSKLCENTPPCGRRVSTQFLVYPISTRVDITVHRSTWKMGDKEGDMSKRIGVFIVLCAFLEHLKMTSCVEIVPVVLLLASSRQVPPRVVV